MNDKNTPDIETMLNTIQDIHPDESLSQYSDTLFDHHYAKQQDKFAKKTKLEWSAVKTLLSPITYPVTWMAQTNMRRATAVCLVFMMMVVGYIVSPPERNVLAATIKALQSVQAMKIQFTSTTGENTLRETILWQHPLRMKVEQFKENDQINKAFWIDDSNVTIVNHQDKTYHQRELEDGETLYGVDGNRWITNATSPMNIVVSYIDFIHQNWDSVSTRQSQVNTSNPITTYQFDYGDGRTTELTIDSNTELPLYLHYIYPANQKREREDTTIQFDWNLALSDIDFNPIIPLDYSPKTVNELRLDDIPSISYPGGAFFVRYDMNPASDPPTTMATVSGSVVDEDGNPIAYATVGIEDGPSTSTDTLGKFHFQFDYSSVISPSQNIYYLKCVADGYEQSSIALQLDQYSPNANPHFILRPGFSISGKVVDENNQPVADANVIYHHPAFGIKTKHNGEFTFKGVWLLNQQIDIIVNKEGYHTGRTIIQPQPHYELENNTITITKQQEISRIIQVIDTDLNPIAGASIQLQNSEEIYETGEDGRFEFKEYLRENNPNPHNYTKQIVVSKEGHASQTTTINLLQDAPHVVSLHASPGMKVRVIDQKGNPVSGVYFEGTPYTINNQQYSYMIIHSYPTDENGMIELRNIYNQHRVFYELKIPNHLPYYISNIKESIVEFNPIQNEPLTIAIENLNLPGKFTPVEGNIYYEETDEPVPFFTIKFTRDFDNEYPKGKFIKNSGEMTVYKSTSGYFRSEFVTDPLRGYKDIIRVRVKEGFSNLVPNSQVHIFTYSLDEIKNTPLRIEIPKANV